MNFPERADTILHWTEGESAEVKVFTVIGGRPKNIILVENRVL